MIDKVKIFVKAGNGGAGCTSFRGPKHSRLRRADGGRGGRGADIVIKVDKNIHHLDNLQFKQQIRAENGKNGQANKKKGADARPYIIKVPVGTVVFDLANNLLLRDLIEDGEELLVAKAGEGGRGNTKAEVAQKGYAGEEKQLSLEWKIVSDFAIVGCPNSGKSSLLAKLTSSHPKIADYPFTTRVPCIGVISLEDLGFDFSLEQTQGLTIVELPGLVKDADQGKGLGTQFLRHAERAKIFIRLIDMSASQGQDPLSDYHTVAEQLRLYNPELEKRPQVIVANKMDQPQAETNLNTFLVKVKKKVYPVSALSGRGLEELLAQLKEIYSGR